MKYLPLSLLVVGLAACVTEQEAGSTLIIVPGGPGSSGSSGQSSDPGAGGASGEQAAGGAGDGAGGTAGSGQGPGGADAGGSSSGGTSGANAGGQGGAGGADAGGTSSGGAGVGGTSGAGAGGASAAGASAAGASAGGQGGKGGAGQGGKAGSGGGGSAGAGGQGGAGGGAGSGGAGSGGAGGGAGGGECPPEMAPVAGGGICVDRWEAHVEELVDGVWKLHSPYETLDDVSGATRAVSAPGVVPQGYISGQQAREACEGAGKRLCARSEYRAACRGPDETVYPYGDEHEDKVCNEGRAQHPIVQLFGGGPDAFSYQHMNDPAVNQLPDSLAATGEYAQCVSGYGAFDMVGNLHEWVDEDDGTFCGGFYVDAEINGAGCLYTTTAHSFTYHDYSTGFRCCLTP